ncbi:hypothetical protein R1sor_018633 [Riccia sorocarpa]|uniref:F-box domain-containing protein n=1 Tax=Riccia sorocarpa TaxID=122646 RepID=A0ABD3IAQ6_9MARC
MEVLRWEALSTAGIETGSWMLHISGAKMALRKASVEVHDSNCGMDVEGDQQQHKISVGEKRKLEETRICLCHVPVDVLAHIFLQLTSFKDLAWASGVCRKWKEGVREALAFREKLSFAGWRADDVTVGGLVQGATKLLELDISLGRWGSRITDGGLHWIASSQCCPNLTSISLWGVTGVTDEGVVELVKMARSLEHLNVGGTFITDVSVLAIADHSHHLKVLNLWGCRHVTESGIVALARSCPKLTSINVWGMNISLTCELRLARMNPNLQLKPSQVRNPVTS